MDLIPCDILRVLCFTEHLACSMVPREPFETTEKVQKMKKLLDFGVDKWYNVDIKRL